MSLHYGRIVLMHYGLSNKQLHFFPVLMLNYKDRGEWGKLSHPPQLNQKAEEKMFMYSIVW